MYTNPDLLGQVVKDHRHQLLREAELERQARRARTGQPGLAMRMRLRVSGLLLSMGRLGAREKPAALSHASYEAPASAPGV